MVEGKSYPVKPIERVNSHALAEDGSINCDRLGTCKSSFDTCRKKIPSHDILETMHDTGVPILPINYIASKWYRIYIDKNEDFKIILTLCACLGI